MEAVVEAISDWLDRMERIAHKDEDWLWTSSGGTFIQDGYHVRRRLLKDF